MPSKASRVRARQQRTGWPDCSHALLKAPSFIPTLIQTLGLTLPESHSSETGNHTHTHCGPIFEKTERSNGHDLVKPAPTPSALTVPEGGIIANFMEGETEAESGEATSPSHIMSPEGWATLRI